MYHSFYVRKIVDVCQVIFKIFYLFVSRVAVVSRRKQHSPGDLQPLYIERIFVYHVFTDTDSTSLQFIVVSSVSSTFTDEQVRNILFEIFSKNEIRERFDKSDKFLPENQKVLGLYEVESIDDPCLVTLAVNRKEYFEYFKSENVNKKHKGIKKGSAGMEYENYAERIKPLHDFDS